MLDQRKYEIMKSLAYGEETPEQIAAINKISLADVQEIQQTEAAEIAAMQEDLQRGGYIE